MYKTILATAFLAVASTSFSAPVVESFAGLSGTFDGATAPGGFTGGGSINAAFTSFSGGSFAGSQILLVNDEATDFPAAADSQYLRWSGDSDRFALYRNAAGIPGTNGTIYAAFAFRIDSLGGTAANNNIEIFRLGQDASFTRDISISLYDGVLGLDDRNGIPAGAGISSSHPFGGTAAAGDWRVLAIEAKFDTTGTTSSVIVTEVGPTGTLTQHLNITGFTAARNGGVTDYGFGAFISVPVGSSACSVSVDEVRIYNNTEVTSSGAFINAVGSDYYGLVNANVSDWNLY